MMMLSQLRRRSNLNYDNRYGHSNKTSTMIGCVAVALVYIVCIYRHMHCTEDQRIERRI